MRTGIITEGLHEVARTIDDPCTRCGVCKTEQILTQKSCCHQDNDLVITQLAPYFMLLPLWKSLVNFPRLIFLPGTSKCWSHVLGLQMVVTTPKFRSSYHVVFGKNYSDKVWDGRESWLMTMVTGHLAGCIRRFLQGNVCLKEPWRFCFPYYWLDPGMQSYSNKIHKDTDASGE